MRDKKIKNDLNQQGFGSGGQLLDEEGGLKDWFGDGIKEIQDLLLEYIREKR